MDWCCTYYDWIDFHRIRWIMKTVIISLGGSVVVQDTINTDFLKKLKELILKRSERFVIVIGGGKVCRMYQDAARTFSAHTEDMDQIGIAVTRVNAELLRTVFGDDAYEDVVTNPTRAVQTNKRIIIASGWKPGFSTDHDAVLLARAYNADTVINMTNVDYVYDRDPKEKGAQKIERMDWERLQNIVGTTWKPGLHAPFDPIATKLGAQLKLKLILVGSDLKNLSNVWDGKKFIGTVVG